ncbi:MAG: DsbA family protein [Candidatus Spechtbacterales bacterium]
MDDQNLDAIQELTKKERRELKRQQKKEERAREQRKSSTMRFFAWALILVLIGGSIWAVLQFVANSGTDVSNVTPQEVTADDWITGNANSSVTLLEYGDFECPACASYHPVLQTLKSEYGDRVAFAYRHFPLSIHPRADETARAAEAAGNQGTFWEMHDMLFERQSAWSKGGNIDDILAGYAEELGLNEDQFRADYNSDEVKGRVEADERAGRAAGVPGTPTFFLNGQAIDSPGNAEEFRNLLNAALNEGA